MTPPARPTHLLRPAAALHARVAARRPRLADALALAPLLVVYLAVCWIVQHGPEPVRDEPDLLPAAMRLLDGQLVPGGEVTDPRSYLWHGPGLVALLAPFVALDLPLQAIRFLMPLLLFAATVLFHRLLRLRLAPGAALAWTYAFGLYVPFYAVLPEVHKEPPSILLVVAAMFALTRGLAGGRPLWLVAAGLSLAALTMIRLEYGWVTIVLLAAALLAWAVRRRSRTAPRLVAVAAVALAGCLPWLGYTYHLTGQPLYWGSSGGLSLYWMSPTVPGENGHWYEPSTVERDPALAPLRPLFRRVETLHPVTSDRVLREQAIASIRARPLAYARNLAANTTRLFFAYPMRWPRLSAIRVGGNVLFNGLLLAGLAWSMLLVWRRRPALPPETVPIAAFAALGVAIHLPVSASPRVLLPVVPALLWIVAQVSAARAPARVPAGPSPPADRTRLVQAPGSRSSGAPATATAPR